MHPSKDPSQTRRRYPMLVQRRHSYVDCPAGGDDMCTYDVLLAAARLHGKYVNLNALFFFVPVPSNSAPLTVPTFVRWVKEAAKAAGLDPTHIASRAVRMGGATDLYDIYGDAAQRFIRERGRWGSDVAQIYQRVSAREHGEKSRNIANSTGVDLQSLLRGWCQTAVSHGRCPL